MLIVNRDNDRWLSVFYCRFSTLATEFSPLFCTKPAFKNSTVSDLPLCAMAPSFLLFRGGTLLPTFLYPSISMVSTKYC